MQPVSVCNRPELFGEELEEEEERGIIFTASFSFLRFCIVFVFVSKICRKKREK
jgi:hypothetical protein